MQAPMRYKTFVWPNNPRTYSIAYKRHTAQHKIPMGTYVLEDLGRACREMRGEGEFFGPKAYETFKALATVFYEGGAGELVHPVWMTTGAYFTELRLTQEPREDYVAYSFTFLEDLSPAQTMKQASPHGETAVYVNVAEGENVWSLAARCGTPASAVLQLNPTIRNGNLLTAGQKVRVR